MNESRTVRRRGPRRSRPALVLAVLIASTLASVLLGLVAGPAASASASLGSVPADVAAYASGGSMVARLSDVYGPNASGTKGIAFDSTTKAGPISRVYEWTAARLANRPTDHPVQLTNNWVVPITIGGKSVGLATIWINPQTVEPELADFAPDAALGTALSTVPATAALVRDTATGAWLALADAKVTPLVAGASGLTTPAPVASLTLSPGSAAPAASSAEPNTGLALAIGIVGLVVVVIVVALVLSRGRRARTTRKGVARDAGAKPLVTAESPEPQPGAAPEPEPQPGKAADSGSSAKTSAPSEPRAAKPSTPKPSTPKPAGARPSGLTPTTSAASKPASSRPGTAKPTASKPPISKPPVPKQPPRPRAPRPKPPVADPEEPVTPGEAGQAGTPDGS